MSLKTALKRSALFGWGGNGLIWTHWTIGSWTLSCVLSNIALEGVRQLGVHIEQHLQDARGGLSGHKYLSDPTETSEAALFVAMVALV